MSLTLQSSGALRFCLLPFAFLLSSCSVPSLETPGCTEAKNAVREFYSYHFGNETKFSAEGLKARDRFLTPEFAKLIAGSQEGTDPFTTGTDDIPKAFRVGECSELTTERTETSVLLFWRTDERTEQRKILVEAVDRNDRWLINTISR